jgi:hypothetical protein
MNDDATSSTLNARIHVDIPAHPSTRHYVIFRDYDELPGLFSIDLGGTLDLVGCTRDEQCEMIDVGCCAVGDYVAVRGDRADLYQESLECADDLVCPRPPIFNHGESAICDNNSHTCEVVLPEDIQCGGRSLNTHTCPDGWDCVGDALALDGFGECVAPL